ncbi:MAG: COG4315 family predicted lipoprotein [Solirubrobacteraceae bacterium]
MRRSALLSFPVLTAALTLAACGGSSYSAGSATPSTASRTTAASSSAAQVKPAANSTLGATILTNAAGMTLYRLSGERAGHFICTAGCLQIWHPLTASASATGAGAVPSLGVVKRPEGSTQLAYKGMPLYTFAQDTHPGDAKGQGLKDVGTWNAVTVTGASGASPAASTTPESSTPASSGGYRY